MATLTVVSPEYPPPGREVTFTVSLSGDETDYVHIWVTDAPVGSELRGRLDDSKDPRRRIHVYSGRGGSSDPFRYTFDRGGKYTLVAQEVIRGASDFGGGYQGDPDGDLGVENEGNPGDITVYIGERLTSTIRAGSDSVDLVLWVWNDTIRATTRGVHGEESPAIVKPTPSARELAVIESADVQTTLSALVDVAVSTALGTVSSTLGNGTGGIVKEFNDHLAQASVHQNNDTENAIPTGLASTSGAKSLKQAINEILPRVRNHYLNDAAYGADPLIGAGRDTGDYHNVSGKVNDNLNLPIIDGAASEEDAYWALADLWRSHEAHRTSTSVHDAADSTNTLSSLPALLAVAKEIFTVWSSTNPTAPSTVSSGATKLIAQAGFRSEPLG